VARHCYVLDRAAHRYSATRNKTSLSYSAFESGELAPRPPRREAPLRVGRGGVSVGIP